jgi:hypothetical protein
MIFCLLYNNALLFSKIKKFYYANRTFWREFYNGSRIFDQVVELYEYYKKILLPDDDHKKNILQN